VGVAIVERDGECLALGSAVREAWAGSGSVVLVHGEAGIGKSSLVRAISDLLPSRGRFLVGYCDELATPQVFGPLRDLAGRVGAPLTRALRRGDREEVIQALRDEFGWASNPAVLVIEDAQWADEGTLDALRYLVRRIAGLPLVLVLTYRDVEVETGHPLRHVLGLAAGQEGTRRLHLAPLSREAVRALGARARWSRTDADEVFAVTSGNPYFVTEVLAAGDVSAVPVTIADSVRARTARLGPAALDVVEQLAVVPAAVPLHLLETLAPAGLPLLAGAEQRGLLTVTPSHVTFRHELTRRAVVDSMPATRRVVANRVVLAALLVQPEVEVSRVVHHAVQAGDTDAIIHYGRIAAREAAAAGAHREAAAHLRLVLTQPRQWDAGTEADLWEALAVEGYVIGAATDETLAAIRRAFALRRGADSRSRGQTLRWLSHLCWWAGDPDAANAAADEALAVLGPAGDDDLLAMAFSNKAQLQTLAGHDADAISAAERAIALGRDNPAVLSHALNNLANTLFRMEHPDAFARMRESLRVALDADEPEHACRAYLNLIEHEIVQLRLDDARAHAAEAIGYAERVEFTNYLWALRAVLAKIHLAAGDLAMAEPEAACESNGSPTSRCNALIVIGRARSRHGAAGAADLLREARDIALRMRESQWIAPATTALAEALVLDGDPTSVEAELVEAYEQARQFAIPAKQAELVYWLRRSGCPVPHHGLLHPYALLADGRWREAADVWHAAGFRYEYALALSESPDPADHLAALSTLHAIGAVPLARQIRARLRTLGVGRIPRGPAPRTRGNPAGLTGRQTQVMRLLIEGLTNAEIAHALVLSVRTVDSHVAAVLGKLGSRTRRDVAARAADLGLTPRP